MAPAIEGRLDYWLSEESFYRAASLSLPLIQYRWSPAVLRASPHHLEKVKLLVYEKVLEDGEVDCQCIDNVLSRINESSWIIRPGVHDYSSYKGTIGYGAKPCSWPPNVARDVNYGMINSSQICTKLQVEAPST